MSKEFIFKVNNQEQFKCDLQSERCECLTSKGLRCKNKTVIGLLTCRVHLASIYKLCIKTSLIPNAGLGLFAKANGMENNEIVFRKDDTIVAYKGEIINKATLDNRYGEFTAPYGAQVNKNQFIDCACARGVGSIANQSTAINNNAYLSLYARDGVISLKAKKNIRNGQEIYLSYGSDYKIHENGVSHETRLKKRKK